MFPLQSLISHFPFSPLIQPSNTKNLNIHVYMMTCVEIVAFTSKHTWMKFAKTKLHPPLSKHSTNFRKILLTPYSSDNWSKQSRQECKYCSNKSILHRSVYSFYGWHQRFYYLKYHEDVVKSVWSIRKGTVENMV